MSRDEAKAKESLTALFAKVDSNSNGTLEYKEFQANWVARMEGCIAEAPSKWHVPAPGGEDMTLTPAERAASQAKADQTTQRLDTELAQFMAVPPTPLGDQGEMVIVGAGLVGALCAVMLAQKGFKVTMFERYGDIRQIPSLGRSINLSVTSRGLRAIRALGGSLYDEVLALTTKVYGRIIHTDGY